MSLVVAYKRDGVVYMGADTQSTSDSTIMRFLNDGGFKVTRLANGMLIGVCGRVKVHQRITAKKKWFEIPENEIFDKRYIVKNIIPKLGVLMKELSEDKDARCSTMEVSILISWRDKMFVITQSFKVYECSRYAAIGAGSDYAKYELSQIGEGNINEGLLKALRSGAYFDSSVSAPYVLIDAKDKEYKLVEG